MYNLKFSSTLIFFFLSFYSDLLCAQNFIASDQDAIDLFKNHSPNYSFEGVYEIFHDVESIYPTEQSLNNNFDGFESQSAKVCIYSEGSKIIAQVIGKGLFNFVRGAKSEFIVDGFNIFRYLYSYKSDDIFNYYPDNKTQYSSIEINNDGDLIFQTSTPLITADGAGRAMVINIRYMFKKIYSPKIASVSSQNIASGTSFALTPNGLIVTNNHVIDGAKNIKVKGINGDFSKSYSAKLIIADKSNDLAILQIDDPSFNTLGAIPYVISTRTKDVGSNVFVLGYPLRQSMGDEIKLTNGIISSKSGYKGDITTYQISVPIQPGNSGGALFDNSGNVIGVVNAKLVGAENASYSIKAPYLINLIETLSPIPKLQSVSSLSNKQLSEQVKQIKKFTYIIEVN